MGECVSFSKWIAKYLCGLDSWVKAALPRTCTELKDQLGVDVSLLSIVIWTIFPAFSHNETVRENKNYYYLMDHFKLKDAVLLCRVDGPGLTNRLLRPWAATPVDAGLN